MSVSDQVGVHVAHNARGQGLILDNVFTGYHRKITIDGVSSSVPIEKMTVLVGANNCRKSTLLSVIAHILQPMGDSILLDGKTIHEQPTKVLSRRLGILPQSPLLPEDLTVYELVSRGRFPRQNFIRQWSDTDEQAVEETLKLTGTQELVHLPVEKLSGGQHQRCWTAMMSAQKTSYILLDRPTTWLDLRYQVEILELLCDLMRHHGRTVVVMLHDLNFAVDHGDTLISLRQGKVVRVLNEGEHCTPELVKTVLDADVHAPINPLTGKPFFMPFRGIEEV